GPAVLDVVEDVAARVRVLQAAGAGAGVRGAEAAIALAGTGREIGDAVAGRVAGPAGVAALAVVRRDAHAGGAGPIARAAGGDQLRAHGVAPRREADAGCAAAVTEAHEVTAHRPEAVHAGDQRLARRDRPVGVDDRAVTVRVGVQGGEARRARSADRTDV